MLNEKMAPITGYHTIHTGIVDLLEKARRSAVRSINSIMTAVILKRT